MSDLLNDCEFTIEDVADLMKHFNRAVIQSSNFEFIVAPKTVGGYFRLCNCKDSIDIKARVVECLSREAYKSCPYKSLSLNADYHKYISSAFNSYFNTNFEESDFETIYTYLGNAIRHSLTRRFVTEGNLSIDWLMTEIQNEKSKRV